MKHLLQYEYFYISPLLLSAIFCGKAFLQKWPKPYRIMAVLVITTLLTEITAIEWKWNWHNAFSWHYTKNNFWIYNIFISIRLAITLSLFYQLTSYQWCKKVILYSGVPILLFGILNYLFIQEPHQYNSFTAIPAHIVVIALCLAYFKQLLDAPGIIALHKEPFVWFASATFIYLSASFPFLIMLDILNIQSQRLSLTFLPINDTLNLILCASYLISFLCKPQSVQQR